MYNIDTKNVIDEKDSATVLLVGGVFLFLFFILISFIPMVKRISFNESIEALDIKYEKVLDPVLYKRHRIYYKYYASYFFEYNGLIYRCESKTSGKSWRFIGKDMVYFDSKNPISCVTSKDAGINETSFLIAIQSLAFMTGTYCFKLFKTKTVMKRYKYLEKHGTLYKNIPYTIEDINRSNADKKCRRFIVAFPLKEGSFIKLTSNKRKDIAHVPMTGLVDVLIDDNNFRNYYIDFDIKTEER